MPAAAYTLPLDSMALARLADGTESQPKSARAKVSAFAFDIVESRAGFDALEGEWNALFERAGRGTQMFQTFNWLWHWCNHYVVGDDAEGGLLSIVTARREGRLVMVWPLVKERSGGFIKLVWMGEPASQYGDVLVDDIPERYRILKDAWDYLSAHSDADVVQLRKVRADASVAPLLKETGALVTGKLRAPYLDLSSAKSFEEYETRYSSGSRRNRKRQRRRLDEKGVINVEFLNSGARARDFTAAAFALKRTWLANRGLVSPALADQRMDRFFADVTEAKVRPAGCHVMAMTCDGAPAALEIGVRCKGRSAIHVIVYDLAFEKVAAGALLMEDSIRHACGDGYTAFDLLAPADGYKVEWADGAVDVCDFAAPLTLAGTAYARIYLGFLREAVKKGVAALPMPLRRRIAKGLNTAVAVL